jgi:hypothetical protein
VLVLADEWPEGSGKAHILRVSDEGVEDAFAVEAQYGFFDGDLALLYRGPNPAQIDELAELDLGTGEETTVAALPAGTWQAAPSPDRVHVAGSIPSESSPSQVFLMALSVSPPATITASLDRPSAYGFMVWLDGASVAFFPFPGDGTERVVVYD